MQIFCLKSTNPSPIKASIQTHKGGGNSQHKTAKSSQIRQPKFTTQNCQKFTDTTAKHTHTKTTKIYITASTHNDFRPKPAKQKTKTTTVSRHTSTTWNRPSQQQGGQTVCQQQTGRTHRQIQSQREQAESEEVLFLIHLL